MGRPAIVSVHHRILDHVCAHLPRLWIDTWDVDFRDELYGWWLIWILGATVYVDAVDAILVYTLRQLLLALHTHSYIRAMMAYMWRSEDCAIPVGHHQIVAIRQTI
jgi:hypothetical protein